MKCAYCSLVVTDLDGARYSLSRAALSKPFLCIVVAFGAFRMSSTSAQTTWSRSGWTVN